MEQSGAEIPGRCQNNNTQADKMTFTNIINNTVLTESALMLYFHYHGITSNTSIMSITGIISVTITLQYQSK